MISNKIEVKTEKNDEFIKGVVERVINRLDNGVGLNIFSLIFPNFHRFVYLQKQPSKHKHQNQIVPSCYYYLKLLIQ